MPPARKTPTRPDDKPFDFNLDAVQAEVDTSPWVTNWGGKPWTFVHWEELDMWEQIALADSGELKATKAVIAMALGDQYVEFSKIRLPRYKFTALWKAYSAFCGIDAGESQDSEPS